MIHRFNEGLVQGSLNHLVQPLLSIDEYESKISDNRAVVVGFFVNDKAPAADLSDFLDGSSLPILDSETSPSPTPDGFYMAFVEIERDKDLPAVIIKMLEDVGNITNVSDWSFQCSGSEDTFPVTIEEITKHVILDPDDMFDDDEETTSPDTVAEQEFWKAASVNSILLESDTLTFFLSGAAYQYQLTENNTDNLILVSNHSSATQLQAVIGPAYTVYQADDRLVVEGSQGFRCLRSI